MAKHLELGELGERLAKEFLENRDYEILESNWRYGKAEIDLIVRKKGILIFVEVRTRSENLVEQPEQTVGKKKERLMAQAAGAYAEKIGHNWEIRFDIISIVHKNGQPFIRHFEDAFFPNWG